MKSTEERFKQKVRIVSGGCWEWQAGMSPTGYGYFAYGGRKKLAHRASWEIFKGPIPRDLQALHQCHKRNCVNPEHLKLGTHLDNMAQMKESGRAKGGSPGLKGEWHNWCKFPDSTIKEIKILHENGVHYTEIMTKYGISRSYVWMIVTGKARK